MKVKQKIENYDALSKDWLNITLDWVILKKELNFKTIIETQLHFISKLDLTIIYKQNLFTFYDTCKFFKISTASLRKLLTVYNLHKTKQESILSEKLHFLKKYGVENPFQAKECKEKIKQTMQNRYGIDSLLKSPEFRNKNKESCFEKYGNENYNNREKAKKTCLEKYGGPAPICSVEVKEKIKQTCLKKYHTSWMGRNHSYHHIDKFFDSKDEKYLYDLFVSIYGYNNVCVHNYSDFLEKEIDFIIIDKKCADWNKVLYIEYHGWYGHGPEPYNPANPNHQKIITQWQTKGFTSFIKLWTYSDPKTLENAKWFNLRYKAIYKNELKAIKSNKHFRDQFIKNLKKL